MTLQIPRPRYNRVEWFWERKNPTHSMLRQIVVGPQFQKFLVLMLPFHLTVTRTLKWGVICFFFDILKGCTWIKICSLACLKAYSEEKLKIVFLLIRSKTALPNCEERKNIFGDCSWMYKEGVFIFQQKILNF